MNRLLEKNRDKAIKAMKRSLNVHRSLEGSKKRRRSTRRNGVELIEKSAGNAWVETQRQIKTIKKDQASDHDPAQILREARANWAQEDVRSNAVLYRLMQIGYREGRYLKAHPDKLLELCEIGLWPEGSRCRPKAEHAERAIFYTMMIIFNATSPADRAKAGKRADAAQYLDEKGVSEDDFIKHLEQYGVEKLHSMAAGERKKRKMGVTALNVFAHDDRLRDDNRFLGSPIDVSGTESEDAHHHMKVLAKPSVITRLGDRPVYLMERSNGRISVSLDPNTFTRPD